MSLSVYMEAVRPTIVFERNITHNLSRMAREAGIFEAIWCPDEMAGVGFGEPVPVSLIVEKLEAGLKDLKARPSHYREFNPENGWGNYDGFVEFVEEYLAGCKANPDAVVRAMG